MADTAYMFVCQPGVHVTVPWILKTLMPNKIRINKNII